MTYMLTHPTGQRAILALMNQMLLVAQAAQDTSAISGQMTPSPAYVMSYWHYRISLVTAEPLRKIHIGAALNVLESHGWARSTADFTPTPMYGGYRGFSMALRWQALVNELVSAGYTVFAVRPLGPEKVQVLTTQRIDYARHLRTAIISEPTDKGHCYLYRLRVPSQDTGLIAGLEWAYRPDGRLKAKLGEGDAR